MTTSPLHRHAESRLAGRRPQPASGPRQSARWLLLAALLFGGNQVAAAQDAVAEPDAAGAEMFERKVRPLLVKHCYACHSSQARQVEAELRLDWREGWRRGGWSGPAVVPGDVEASLLIKAVRYGDESLQMPPKGRLSAREISDLETWVSLGAPDPRTQPPGTPQPNDPAGERDFWSFRPLALPTVPPVRDTAWPLNEVDRFILAAMESRGLRPAPTADKRTLLRRVTYDLTGLPPTLDEITEFLADESPTAFARLVDRLLASPAYGERWGRHWLDVVRYADTAGDNSDYPVPQLYKYRNWVFDAFNQDMPYDDFVRAQLAGDLLPASSREQRHANLVATGYLANARRFGSYEDARYPWHLTIEDTIDNLGRTFLGLSINCCRCHDHKFDPLTNEDYYALYGFFQSTRYPWPGIELDKAPRDLVPLAPAEEVAAADKRRRQELARLDVRMKSLEKEKSAADQRLAEAEQTSDQQQRKARIADAARRVEEVVRAIKALRKERETVAKAALPYDTAYAVAEAVNNGKRKVGNACVQIQGDPQRLGAEVPRRFPAVLGSQMLPSDVAGSGRLELAGWIVDPANPLAARVMVNRIWQHHFGRAIVQTPSDFGRQGSRPTHPELLDYLARRFIDSGWSIKSMHRMLLLTRTYQLSSAADRSSTDLDPSNDFLSHFSRRRLDAESIRDTLLAVSGDLDRSPGGPHPFPDQTTWDFTQHKPFKAVYETNRRSVYLMTQRIQRHPFLALFDGADTNAGTPLRVVSTTPLQSLYLMNDPFVHQQAEKFARRLLAEPIDETARIDRACCLAFGRPATAQEQTGALEHLSRVRQKLAAAGLDDRHRALQAWQSLSRALFLSNELVYLD